MSAFVLAAVVARMFFLNHVVGPMQSEKELLVELISNGGIIHLKCILMIQKVLH